LNPTFKIFVIDDDPAVLLAMRSILEPDYAVETFESVEACLPRLDAEKPDMFLLDVSLPGMDGYAFCRQIKDDADMNHIPVTFVSSYDTIDARLSGYNAGGEDFIVKPFEPAEVISKVKVAQQITLSKQSLKEQAEASEYLATLALASMDEAGIVLQFMSKLIAWDNDQEIAAGLLELMQRYQLNGVVQTRIAERTLTLSSAGTNLPLETSVMEHARTMGRIFEFSNRSVHNFDRVTLMVNNSPLHDPDFCGRLRDNLSVAAQGADSRLHAVEIEEANRRNQAGILGALERIHVSIGSMRKSHELVRNQSSSLVLELGESLADAFVHLGLTDNQERFLEDMVNEFMRRLVELFDRGEETYQSFQELSQQLGALKQ